MGDERRKCVSLLALIFEGVSTFFVDFAHAAQTAIYSEITARFLVLPLSLGHAKKKTKEITSAGRPVQVHEMGLSLSRIDFSLGF